MRTKLLPLFLFVVFGMMSNHFVVAVNNGNNNDTSYYVRGYIDFYQQPKLDCANIENVTEVMIRMSNWINANFIGNITNWETCTFLSNLVWNHAVPTNWNILDAVAAGTGAQRNYWNNYITVWRMWYSSVNFYPNDLYTRICIPFFYSPPNTSSSSSSFSSLKVYNSLFTLLLFVFCIIYNTYNSLLC